ncbi:hypothetical protein JCM3766R1_004524 [Sporobolomyces carnicolor]
MSLSRLLSVESMEGLDRGPLPSEPIDRLSRLPDELLDQIFDGANDLDHPSTGPLSRRLLPWHIRGLYRRVKLVKVATLEKFSRTVRSVPNLAQNVRILHVVKTNEDKSESLLDNLVETLSRLEELRIYDHELSSRFLCYLGPDPPLPPQSLSSSLCYLRIEGPETNVGFPLSLFSPLESLVTLEYGNYIFPHGRVDTSTIRIMTTLANLAVEGVYSDDPAIGVFCSLCPNLVSVRLNAIEPEYEDLLSFLPAHIRNLVLWRSTPTSAEPCDQFVARFARLKSLTLDGTLYSYYVDTHLAGLSELEHLKFGHGEISLEGLRSLVAGPDRLASLETIELEMGLEGYRSEETDEEEETTLTEGNVASFVEFAERHGVRITVVGDLKTILS